MRSGSARSGSEKRKRKMRKLARQWDEPKIADER
jgi:hypothetical protein